MDIQKLISEMSLEEKASLCAGKDFWHTRGYEEYGIPEMMVSDGPHGLRKQEGEADHLGMNESIEAVCFPAGCALASSFDRELMRTLGETLGNECQAEDVGILLGPAVNIKRSPLCGRNFEYLSEDPYMASEMAASYVNGVQSQGVGTSVKHFWANNQEKRRMNSSSELDERTAREIYLRVFERIVKQSQPWSVMCSYNQINGVYSAENRQYLTDVLRGEWGFEGFVVSDWGAANAAVEDLAAGLDLEMPYPGESCKNRIVAAVSKGQLEEKVLDQAVERILKSVKKYQDNRKKDAVFSREKDHVIARQAAAESMVLLKNNGVLPLGREEQVIFVGEFAQRPRFQGGGSSHIHASKIESAQEMAPENVRFYRGYETDTDAVNPAWMEEAVDAAKKAEKVVIFAGLPDSYESEGYDRIHMRMPENQNLLIRELAKANPNLVVVLHNGSPMEMPWAGDAAAILETYLGGEAVGGAAVQVLYGDVNPSGHLAETFPLRLQDTPSYFTFGGERGIVKYTEGVFVGYRYYDSKDMEVLFPFGHGLSYTDFSFENLAVDREKAEAGESVQVSLDITNIGSRFGKEVVQLYVAPGKREVIRPVHELRRFEKVALEPGETKHICFTLGAEDFSYYEERIRDWYVEPGEYVIEVGNSSRNLPLRKSITMENPVAFPLKITLDTPLQELLRLPLGQQLLGGMMAQTANSEEAEGQVGEAMSQEMIDAMMSEIPLRSMVMFSGGQFTYEQADALVAALNQSLEESAEE